MAKSFLKETIMLRCFGLMKVPLIWSVSPKIIKMSEEESVVGIKLKRKTKNHLNSMYFGSLCIGADLVGGLCAYSYAMKKGKFSLAFKSFSADFHKRADGDVLFVNKQGKEIRDFVDEAMKSNERKNMMIDIYAVCPDKYADEKVASFKLELSLKRK